VKLLHHFGFSCVTESVLFALGTPSSIFNENTILSRGLSGQMSRLHVCGVWHFERNQLNHCTVLVIFVSQSHCFSAWAYMQ
jgi:hypothetical protein